MKIFAAVGVAVATLTGCGSTGGEAGANEETVGPADISGDWPFSVDSGTLRCDAFAVTFETGGDVYAINGTARSADAGIDIFESDLWLDNPDIPGAKVDIGDVIARGLELCPPS